MWADGRTDMMKLIVAFRNIAKAPKNCAHMTYPGTSLPCPQEPRACHCSEPDEPSPHHYTLRSFKVCLYHPQIYVFP